MRSISKLHSTIWDVITTLAFMIDTSKRYNNIEQIYVYDVSEMNTMSDRYAHISDTMDTNISFR